MVELSVPQEWKLVILLAVVSILALGRSCHRRKRSRLPPGPAKVPILGNLHQLGTLPHRALRDLARIHGPVMMLRLGKAPAVVLSSAEVAWEALKTHDLDCCTRPVSPGTMRLTYDLKTVAFSPYGAYWREVRKILVVELLSASRVRAAWYARHEQVYIYAPNIYCQC
jgi:4-hydroxyphenylacetaldehyde oxime monooxygenase